MRARALLLALAAVPAAGCGGCGEAPASGRPLIQVIERPLQLIGGLEAAGRIGDFLLDNGKVRFVVQAAGSATGWGPYGGSILDLDLSSDASTPRPGDDRLQEIFLECNLRGFAPDQATIVNDGRDGSPAILRFTGQDRGIPLLDAVLTTTDADLAITLDYVLAPGGQTLELVVTAKDAAGQESREVACGLLVLPGDANLRFMGESGFGGSAGELSAFVAAGDGAASFAVARPKGPLSVVFPIEEILPLVADTRQIDPNAWIEERFWVSAGARDVEGALSELRRLRADATVLQKVSFSFPAAAVLQPYVLGARVDFFDEGRPDGAQAVTSARIDPTTFEATVELAPGSYRAEIVRDGAVVEAQRFSVADSAVTRTAAPPAAGFLKLSSARTDREGQVLGPTAAKLTVIKGKGGARDAQPFHRTYVAPTDQLALPAGDYTLYFSRGPEYELDRHEVTVSSAATTTLTVQLMHVVDTTGWVSADLHVHSTKSVDADAALEGRVLGAIAEGLEILVATDHDVAMDYGPTASALGVEALVRTVVGTEISPMYGHMNAFPVPVHSPVKYWDLPWAEYGGASGDTFRALDPHEIVALARARGAEIVQLNHPRGKRALFEYIGLDPDTLETTRPFPPADAFEIMNGPGGGGFEPGLTDLIGFHRHNRPLTATGVSDAHTLTSALGYARTFIASTSDEPPSIDLPAVWRALREGRVVAANGPFLRLTARRGSRRAGIGEVLTGTGALSLDIEVQAPSWMAVDHLRLLAGGEPVLDRLIRPTDADPANPVVRLATTVTASPARDTFYLAIVEGSAPGAPVMTGRARSITNPLFVDVDGGGYHFGD